MTAGEFYEIMRKMHTMSLNILDAKELEYGSNKDRLVDFRTAAALQNCEPETALGGMLAKHIASIFHFIQNLEQGIHKDIHIWDEKLVDAINYLILLRALLAERYHE